MVTDFTYNAITTDFWANLDAVGPPESWETPRHGRRCQGAAGPVELPVARLGALPDPQGDGRGGVFVSLKLLSMSCQL